MGLVQRTGSGVTVHNLLTGRAEADAHPQSAVTGLEAAIAALGTAAGVSIADVANHFTATDTEGALAELFTSASNGKASLVSGIETKGGTVTQAGDVVTFAELGAGIASIDVGVDTSDATAAAGDIAAPKTAYGSAGTKITGTATDKRGSATVITPGTADQTIPAGLYGGAAGDGKVLGDADLIQANIKNGVNIFGVVGNYSGTGYNTSDATMIAADLRTGKTGYISTGKITGTMTDHTGAGNDATSWTNATADTAVEAVPAAGYWDGTHGIALTDADLVAANILSGINIFGVAGTAKRFATGTHTPGSDASSITIATGLSWTIGKFIVVYSDSFTFNGFAMDVFAYLGGNIIAFGGNHYQFTTEQTGGAYKYLYNSSITISSGNVTCNTGGGTNGMTFKSGKQYTWIAIEA